MAINLNPQCYNWPAVNQGDTYPAQQFTSSDSETALARVRVKVVDLDGATALDLDSDTTGCTITSATAGAWNFQIDEISDTTTATLTAGFYKQDMELTDDAGTVRTVSTGTWQILPQL